MVATEPEDRAVVVSEVWVVAMTGPWVGLVTEP